MFGTAFCCVLVTRSGRIDWNSSTVIFKVPIWQPWFELIVKEHKCVKCIKLARRRKTRANFVFWLRYAAIVYTFPLPAAGAVDCLFSPL